MSFTPVNQNISDGDITSQFLPDVVSQDPSFAASIEQTTGALQAFMSKINNLLIKPNFYNLPEAVIDELGVEFQPPGFNQTWELWRKQQAISTACYDNAHLGTTLSVQNLCNKAFGAATVEEWWEYGGEEYHFRIITEDPLVDQTKIADLNEAILATKPLSRWPDGIFRVGGGVGSTNVGAAFFQVRTRKFPVTIAP